MNYKEEITINQVILLGRICNDIELKQTQNNKSYTRFSLAVNRKGKDKSTDFISCLAWEKTAEFIQKYMKKGSQICISGRLQTGKYEDKDAKMVYTTDVIVEEVDFAESKKESTTSQELVSNQSITNPQVTDDLDELPF